MSAVDSFRRYMEQLDPTPTDSDIDAQGFDGGERVGGWRVTDAGSADWALRRIAEKRGHLAEIEEHADEVIAQVTAWLEGERQREEPRIEFFASLLADYHRDLLAADPKAKTVHLLNGKLVARQTPDRVEVDESKVPTLPLEFQRVKIEADKKALLAHIKATGELPNGVTLVPGEIKFTAKTGGDE